MFIHALTSGLAPDEAERLRRVFNEQEGHGSIGDMGDLSAEGSAISSLFTAGDVDRAEVALRRLPTAMQERLDALSPLAVLKDIHAPLIILLHDRGDQVIPVGESRRLRAALAGRGGVQYTELLFQHLDPVKGKLPLLRLLQQLGRFFLAVIPLFLHTERPA